MSDETLEKKPDTGPVDESPFHLTDDEIREIVTAARAQDADTVHAHLDDLSIADTAELIEKVSEEDRRELLAMYSDVMNPLVFSHMDAELRRSALSSMPAANVAGLLSVLESDDALDLILNLDPARQQEIIRKLSAKTRVVLEEGLSFPEDSAGRLMQRETVAVPQSWTIGKTIDYLRAAALDLPEDFFDVFVIDPTHHVVGQIPLNRLVRSERTVRIKDLTLNEVQPIPAEMDQEEVAHIFRRDDIASAPVVDSDGRLLGVITIDDIVDVIDKEAQEDILKMGGVGNQSDIYRPAISTSYSRSRWLALNLLTAFLASWVVSLFSETIDRVVALAILMPIVAGMGGNAGTQTLAVIVRAIAVHELSGTNAPRAVYKEALVGFLNGVVFAALTGLCIMAWFHSLMLGVVIGAAMIINLLAAGLFGAAIPIVLDRMGHDPAISSSIFLTTVTDVVGFLAFLGLAALMIH